MELPFMLPIGARRLTWHCLLPLLLMSFIQIRTLIDQTRTV